MLVGRNHFIAKEKIMADRLNQFDHVGVIVENLEASIAWYEQHLGFRRLTDFSFPGARVAFIGRGDLKLEFFQVDGATSRSSLMTLMKLLRNCKPRASS
jgi:hypothetical protein